MADTFAQHGKLRKLYGELPGDTFGKTFVELESIIFGDASAEAHALDAEWAASGAAKRCGTMGWEQRGGRSYYYRKERVGSRVRSVYVGTGTLALLGSRLDALQREEGEAEREEWRRTKARHAEEDSAIAAIAEMVEDLKAAPLLAAGFHTHKRAWRLIRGGKS